MIVFKSTLTSEWNTKFSSAADYVIIMYKIDPRAIYRERENFLQSIIQPDCDYCLYTGEDK